MKCLIKDVRYTDASVMQAIRQSVRGTAANLLVCLGEECDAFAVLAKFDGVFGNVYSSDQLLHEFYLAEQKSGEEVFKYQFKQMFSPCIFFYEAEM